MKTTLHVLVFKKHPKAPVEYYMKT